MVGLSCAAMTKADTPAHAPRHRLTTRLWHWINALAVIVLVMSGLMIFNAHPRLYWGEAGALGDPAWLEIGDFSAIAFPGWATIPSDYSLSDARLWHLAFAWVLALGLALFLIASLANRHIARDLHLTRANWHPTRLWQAMIRHGAEDRHRYNPVQKLAYAVVLFGLLPCLIATGLAMSPGMDAAWPWLTKIWGGRQSARSVHFLCTFALLGFVLVHLVMVLLTGPGLQIRAMITGGERLP